MKYTPEKLTKTFMIEGMNLEDKRHWKPLDDDNKRGLFTSALVLESRLLLKRSIHLHGNVIVVERANDVLVTVLGNALGAITGTDVGGVVSADWRDVCHSLAFNVFAKKNADYGDSFADCGVPGIVVRILDKLNRLESLRHKEIEVTSERQHDTIIDVANYAGMALMLLAETE